MMRARSLITTGLVALGVLAGSGIVTSASAFAAKPVVNPGAVLGVTPATASVYAFVGAEELATSCVVEYGETTSYGSSAPCEPATLEGSEEQFTIGSLTGLEPATTYHYRFVATNTSGETKDADGELTTVTLQVPAVDGESVSGLTSTDATLEAQVNPNYQETTYAFEYATNPALTGATSVAGASPLPAEFGDQPASVDMGGGLQPRTTYYYRAVAMNATGPRDGNVGSFTTLSAPAVASGEAREVTRTTATLTGTVDPAGAATGYHFEYIDQAGYEAALAESAVNPYGRGDITPGLSAGSDYTIHPVSLGVSELQPGTTYHYTIIATNSLGTVTSTPDATFTTSPPTPPVAFTGNAVNVGQLSATLTGGVNTQGLSTTMQFEFGTTPSLGSVVPASIASESGSVVGIRASFGTYLQAGSTYYYRTVATNTDGTSQGTVKSFTTGSIPGLPTLASIPVLALPPSPVSAESKTTTPKKLNNAQKLASALKACSKKPKGKRAGCQKQARNKFAPAKKNSKKKK
jgi:hypothetical protein